MAVEWNHLLTALGGSTAVTVLCFKLFAGNVSKKMDKVEKKLSGQIDKLDDRAHHCETERLPKIEGELNHLRGRCNGAVKA